MRESIGKTEFKMLQIEESITRVREFDKILASASATVEQAPWQAHKDELIETYRQMQGGEPAPPERYQQIADLTVGKIAADVRKAMQPLHQAAISDPGIQKDLAGIEKSTNRVLGSIDRWEQDNLGRRWFSTISSKNRTLHTLNSDVEDDLSSVVGQVSNSIDELSAEIETTQEELSGQYSSLEQKAQEQESALAVLEEEMQSVLPAWVRGLIGVEDMVQAFPFVVLGVAMYLLVSALLLTRHYRSMAIGRQWSRHEQNNPLYSSPWTLVYRGPAGTAATITLYALVFAISIYLAWAGGRILLEWIATGHEPALTNVNYQVLLYTAHGVLVAGFAVVLIKLLKDRAGDDE